MISKSHVFKNKTKELMLKKFECSSTSFLISSSFCTVNPVVGYVIYLMFCESRTCS